MAKIVQFLRETRTEMKAVIWPTKTRAALYGLVVIIFSLVLGYVLFGFDEAFRILLRGIIF